MAHSPQVLSQANPGLGSIPHMCNPLLNSHVLGAYLALKTHYLQEAAVTQCLQEF